MIAEEGKAGRKTGERWSAILVPSPTASNTQDLGKGPGDRGAAIDDVRPPQREQFAPPAARGRSQLQERPHAPWSGSALHNQFLLRGCERGALVLPRYRRLALRDRVGGHQPPTDGPGKRAGHHAGDVPDRLRTHRPWRPALAYVAARFQQTRPFAVQVKRGDLGQWHGRQLRRQIGRLLAVTFDGLN